MDANKLRKAINHYKFYSMPSNGIGSAPATVNDIRTVVTNTAKLMTAFLKELENNN